MIILTSDLHLTDKPSDTYRFDIFDAICDWCEQYPISDIIILGDLTDKKDNHSGKLVNKIVNGIFSLTAYCDVNILMGNHDYIDPENPYFEFLEVIPQAHFIDTPFFTFIDGASVLFMPHQKELTMPQIPVAYKHLDLIFIHQCVDGAIAETGKRLSGIDISPLSDLKPKGGIWAGDIHKPQRVGAVTYVGAPYNVRFGDKFTPRCVLLDPEDFTYRELFFKAPRKHSVVLRDVEELVNYNFTEGDHVKITIQLTKEEVPDWSEQKAEAIKSCKDYRLELFGIKLEVQKSSKRVRLKQTKRTGVQPRETLKDFCKYEQVPSEVQEAGQAIIEE